MIGYAAHSASLQNRQLFPTPGLKDFPQEVK
jgi:hypothetical protein